MGDRQRFMPLLRSRHPCIAIATAEEQHAVEVVVSVAIDLGRPLRLWSAVRGLYEGIFANGVRQVPLTEQPLAALKLLTEDTQPLVMAFLDLAPHLDSEVLRRALREAIEHCRRTGGTVILIDHGDELPPAIASAAMRFDLTLPDEQELVELARDVLRRLRNQDHVAIDVTNAQFLAAVSHLRGLTRNQAQQVLTEVALADDRFDAGDIAGVMDRRRQLLQTDGLLEHIALPVSLDEIAGLRRLKRWLEVRRHALEAKPGSGIERPRGVLLLGVPGTGKSLCAKAIATAWKQPLLRLDAGVLYDRWVGETERRMREALRQAEAIAPMVLWIDEIEKAFASASSHNADGGLSQRLFASLLTWMQERRAPVFLVATANDIEVLPPELLRRGRFDAIFFTDLPDRGLRIELLRIHLAKRGLDPARFALEALADACPETSGAEIEQAVIAAVLEAYADGTVVDQQRMLAELQATTPLAVTMAEKIAALREWAAHRCTPADG